MDNITIEKTPGYKCGNFFFADIQDAQRHALENLIPAETATITPKDFSGIIVDNSKAVIAILTGTKPRRKRSDAGKSHARPHNISAATGKRLADTQPYFPPPTKEGVAVEASSKYKNK